MENIDQTTATTGDAAEDQTPAQPEATQETGTQDSSSTEQVSEPTAETATDVVAETKVETPVAPVPEVPAAKVEAPVVEQATEVVQDNFEATFDKIAQTGSTHEKALINALKTYVSTMAPGQTMDPDAGASRQYHLWMSLRSVIQAAPEQEFKRLWSIVLAFAEKYKDAAFGERYVMRFAEYWRQDTDELTAFQRLINLIKLTCDPQTREKGLRQVDLTRSLDKGLSEQGRSRIISFYQ